MIEDNGNLLENAEINSTTSTSTNDTNNIESVRAPTNRTSIPLKIPQIWTGFVASLSALSAGMILGWTSPIFDYLQDGKYNNISTDINQMGWIGSFATVGAMIMCIPTGFICDLIGRKKTLLFLIIPFSTGWAFIIWARTIFTLYIGRLITGMAVGACCVATPLYNGEIAHQSLRGALGSFFQLMIVTGIFISYLLGELMSPEKFTIICALVPFIFFVLFAFQPESPCFLIKKGDFDGAKRSLLILRGPNYDVDAEFNQIEGSLKDHSQSVASLRNLFQKRSVIKGIIISFGLMFFQQFSGINVIVLYSSDIFKSTGIKFNSNIATIIVGAVQVFATFLSSLIIEKVGRKILLFISLAAVTINTVILSIYFSLKFRAHLDDDVLKDISFIPIGAVCLFIFAFSLGLGPIPWMICSEILPTEIRSLVGSTAGTFNWLLAFIITKFYFNLCHEIGYDSVFYTFALLSFSGMIFILGILPETKGKSVEEIQAELNN